HPPTSTLFPYTTLFRSVPRTPTPRIVTRSLGPWIWLTKPGTTEPGTSGEIASKSVEASLAALPPPSAEQTTEVPSVLSRTSLVGDRKSTRLNSSHQIIS